MSGSPVRLRFPASACIRWRRSLPPAPETGHTPTAQRGCGRLSGRTWAWCAFGPRRRVGSDPDHPTTPTYRVFNIAKTRKAASGSWYSEMASTLCLTGGSSRVSDRAQGERRRGSYASYGMADSNSSPDRQSSGDRRPYLVVVAGIGVGRAFPVTERTEIGRDPEGDVVLPARTISWKHLVVSSRAGVIEAQDLGS